MTAKDQGKVFLFSVGTKMEAGGIQFMEEMCQQEWCEDSGLPEKSRRGMGCGDAFATGIADTK